MTDERIDASSSTCQFDEEASSSAETRVCFAFAFCRLVHSSGVSNRTPRAQSQGRDPPRARHSQRYFGLGFCISVVGKKKK